MGSFHIFKAVAAKKAGSLKDAFRAKKKSEPVDRNLPFDIHIDGNISLDTVPFLIHGDKLAMERPGKACRVTAYGRIGMDGTTIHRFYLQDAADEDRTALLQVVVDGDSVAECRLFSSLDEVCPDSRDEWAFWLDEEEGYIGWSAFEDKKARVFDRIWGDEDEPRTAPVEFTETVYLDRFGEKTLTVSHAAMLYGRWVDEETEMAEFVMLSAEEHSDETALVQILAGIDINPGSIKVNY